MALASKRRAAQQPAGAPSPAKAPRTAPPSSQSSASSPAHSSDAATYPRGGAAAQQAAAQQQQQQQAAGAAAAAVAPAALHPHALPHSHHPHQALHIILHAPLGAMAPPMGLPIPSLGPLVVMQRARTKGPQQAAVAWQMQ